VCVENGHEVYPGHQQIVAHIVLALYARGGTEIGADGYIGSTRNIAALSKTWKGIGRRDQQSTNKQSERRYFDIQISSVIPDWA
jgi:hypothetical protein